MKYFEFKLVRDKKSPVIQANSMESIIKLMESLRVQDFLNADEISKLLSFVKRQSNYYTAAASEMGLIATYKMPDGHVKFGLHKGALRFFSGHSVNRKLLAQHLHAISFATKQFTRLTSEFKTGTTIYKRRMDSIRAIAD